MCAIQPLMGSFAQTPDNSAPSSLIVSAACVRVRFLPHASSDYIALYSPNDLPDPGAPLPPHSSVSDLFVRYIDCLHYQTHHILLLLELSFACLIGLLFVAALLRRYHRLRAGNLTLKDMLLPSSAAVEDSPASSLLSSSHSSFAAFFLALLLCMCSFVALLLGSHLDWTLLYWSSPLLLSHLFLTLFAQLFFLLAVKQYCLLLLRSFPLSAVPSPLSSSAFSRLYTALLVLFCCVFVVSFLFLLLFVSISSSVLRARFLVATVVFSSVSLFVTLALLVVQLQLVRRHIRELSMPYLSAQLLPLLPSMSPLPPPTSSSSSLSHASLTSKSSLSSLTSESAACDAAASYGYLRAHSSHCRNAQYWLALHGLFYFAISAFIIDSRPHYHLMHGLLVNTLLTVAALTYLCTVSLPVRWQGKDGRVGWGVSSDSVGGVRSANPLASLRSILEEEEADEFSRNGRHVYPL